MTYQDLEEAAKLLENKKKAEKIKVDLENPNTKIMLDYLIGNATHIPAFSPEFKRGIQDEIIRRIELQIKYFSLHLESLGFSDSA